MHPTDAAEAELLFMVVCHGMKLDVSLAVVVVSEMLANGLLTQASLESLHPNVRRLLNL